MSTHLPKLDLGIGKAFAGRGYTGIFQARRLPLAPCSMPCYG